MLTFTRDDLAQALIAKKTASKKVHVVLDNNTDTGNEFATLKNAGVDVLLKASSLTGLLHHKYAVIDETIVWYGSISFLSFGQAEAMRDTEDVRVYHHSLSLAEGNTEDDVGRLAGRAGDGD